VQTPLPLPGPPQTRSRARAAPWLAAGSALLLASCAGAHVSGLTMQQDNATAAPLAVEVATLPPAPPSAGGSESADATRLLARDAAALRKVLIAALLKQGISGPASPGTPSLVLQVDLADANGGSILSRDVIGFGAGKSRLAGNVRLEDGRDTPPRTLESFAISADSGNMPGLLISAVNPIALAARGGMTVVRGATSDGHEDADRAARSIASKVVSYYRAQGWIPAG
jgi:hypothetical protein